MNKRKVVTYFSITGTTERAARMLGEVAGADVVPIEAQTPYSSADVDWRNKQSRCVAEHEDSALRPEIASAPNADEYDVIFLGYPLWWEQAPNIIRSFLESQQWAGKTIIPFATSSSSISGSDGNHLHSSAPDADWKEGRRITYRDTVQSLEQWIQQLGIE